MLHLLTSDLSYMLKIARQKLDKHKRPSKLVRCCTVDLIGLYNVHLCCQSTSGETFSTYYVLLSLILNIWIWRTDKSGIISGFSTMIYTNSYVIYLSDLPPNSFYVSYGTLTLHRSRNVGGALNLKVMQWFPKKALMTKRFNSSSRVFYALGSLAHN